MARQRAIIDAIDSGDVERVADLVASGTDLNIDVPPSLQPLGTGRSLLDLIVYRRQMADEESRKKYLTIMRLLVEAGIDLNRISVNHTPLSGAAKWNDAEAVAQLLKGCLLYTSP